MLYLTENHACHFYFNVQNIQINSGKHEITINSFSSLSRLGFGLDTDFAFTFSFSNSTVVYTQSGADYVEKECIQIHYKLPLVVKMHRRNSAENIKRRDAHCTHKYLYFSWVE